MSIFALLMSILFVLLKIFVFGTLTALVLAFTLGPIFAGVMQVLRRARGRKNETP